MLNNEKYKWVLDWREDRNLILPKVIYWMNLYNKLYNDGNANDRLKLRHLYNKRKKSTHTNFVIGVLETLFNPADCYRYACKRFIDDIYSESVQDDLQKKIEVTNAIMEYNLKQSANKLFGCDIDEYHRQILNLEKECEKHHTYCNTTVRYENGNLLPSMPNSVLSLMQPIIFEGSKEFSRTLTKMNGKCIDYIGLKKITVYYRVHDKIEGFYCMEIFTDNEYDEYTDAEKKCVKRTVIFAKHLAKEYDGMLEIHKFNAYLNKKVDFVMNRMRNECNGNVINSTTKKSKSKNRKKDEPDISKINRALGYTDNEEEFNGDIF